MLRRYCSACLASSFFPSSQGLFERQWSLGKRLKLRLIITAHLLGGKGCGFVPEVVRDDLDHI